MVHVGESIEIAASPEAVRAIFLDFAKLPTWNTVFTSIESEKVPTDLQEGDPVTVTLSGMSAFKGTILVNTPSRFSWRGSLPYIFTGDHLFRFEPSEITPGSTTFTNSEEFSGLLSFMMSSWLPTGTSTRANFAKFCTELKTRAESQS